jgi:WG containing repeat
MLTMLAATVLGTTLLLAQPISLHVFGKAGKYGFVDDDGVLRIPARFDRALEFAENMAPAARLEGTKVYGRGEAGPDCRIQALRWGYIDPTGEMASPNGAAGSSTERAST